MSNALVEKKLKKVDKSTSQIDLFLLLLFVILILFGLVMLYSASYYYGLMRFDNGFYYVQQQARGVVLGGALMFFMSRVDYRRWRNPYILGAIYVASILLLLACYLPGIGTNLNGAQRWIKLPIIGSFQPSEFSKFALMIVLAGVISYYKPGRMQKFTRGIVPLLFLVLLIGGIILIQPNFSIFSIVMMTSFVMLFIGGMSRKHIIIMLILGLVAGMALMIAEPYRIARVLGFLDPFAEGAKSGTSSYDPFQIQQSLYAIGSGGLFGRGFANSRQKYLFLPYGESDYIFSIFAEERGFIGCLLLITLFLLIIWRGYRVAWRCQDTFGKLAATGIVTLIGIQTMVNIAVATSSMPATGVPLPFISSGSSSMVCSMGAAGLLLSISRVRTLPVEIKKKEKQGIISPPRPKAMTG